MQLNENICPIAYVYSLITVISFYAFLCKYIKFRQWEFSEYLIGKRQMQDKKKDVVRKSYVLN